jgi:hypothetical protein
MLPQAMGHLEAALHNIKRKKSQSKVVEFAVDSHGSDVV